MPATHKYYRLDNDEPYFSWLPCEGCQDPLGGDRFDVYATDIPSGDSDVASLCPDCVQSLLG